MPDASAYALPATLAAENAALLREELLQERPAAIDASHVTHIGTPCIQVLLSFSRSMQAEGSDVAVKGMSDVFRNAVSDLGLYVEDGGPIKFS